MNWTDWTRGIFQSPDFLPLSSFGPGAPAIHLTSSCSSAWGWVLRRSLSLSLSSPLLSFIVVHWSVPVIHPSPSWGWVLLACFIPVIPLVVVWSWCTRHPPDEELLIGMVGAGAGAGSAPSPSSLVIRPWCTHHPPDKQLLVGVWVGVCFVVVVPVLIVPCSPFHP
jgi:hypothetical protein